MDAVIWMVIGAAAAIVAWVVAWEIMGRRGKR